MTSTVCLANSRGVFGCLLCCGREGRSFRWAWGAGWVCGCQHLSNWLWHVSWLPCPLWVACCWIMRRDRACRVRLRKNDEWGMTERTYFWESTIDSNAFDFSVLAYLNENGQNSKKGLFLWIIHFTKFHSLYIGTSTSTFSTGNVKIHPFLKNRPFLAKTDNS